jgi:hypothetical protein
MSWKPQKRIAELETREVKLPNPHAHLIWIQAGHALMTIGMMLPFLIAKRISAAMVQIAIRFISGKSKRHYLLLASISPQPVKESENEIRNPGIRRY